MKFLIISHADHGSDLSGIYSYGPYVREMDLWIKYADKVRIVAPQKITAPDNIDLYFVATEKISLRPVKSFNFLSLKNSVAAMFVLTVASFKIIANMVWADHIHIRCPGNMGLLGMFCQILFPWKIKTVKYAGNWDDYEGEHKSYRVQKWLARNTVLTHHALVIIYGQWKNFTKNCVAFFTASYPDTALQIPVPERTMNDATIRLIFAGTLDERKRPDMSIEVVRLLANQGYENVVLDIYGEGPDRGLCEELIVRYNLQNKVTLRGNVSPMQIAGHYREAHFLLFLSRMEGWPKVVAESMFWGCVPITTAISCVPWMLDYGKRGVLVERDAVAAADAVVGLLRNPEGYGDIRMNAMAWSRTYTLDYFEKEIMTLMQKRV